MTLSHSSISSLKGPLKGEKVMAWAVTICSSKRLMASSNPEIVSVPDFLNSGVLKT
jgi:hypothetical protein